MSSDLINGVVGALESLLLPVLGPAVELPRRRIARACKYRVGRHHVAIREKSVKVTREEVYRALDGERDYQRSKALGIGDTEEHFHSLEEWAVYIEDYLAELKHSLSRVWRKDGQPTIEELNTLRKITAMGVAAMEQHGAPRR